MSEVANYLRKRRTQITTFLFASLMYAFYSSVCSLSITRATASKKPTSLWVETVAACGGFFSVNH